jgi:hypothetical protein
MILVSVQFIDTEAQGALYNGGLAVHFYNLAEAKLFAQNESAQYPGTNNHARGLCKVYNDGVIVQVWENGQDITG